VAWLTRGRAAAALGISPSAVQRRGVAGTLTTEDRGNGTRLYWVEVEGDGGLRGEDTDHVRHGGDGGRGEPGGGHAASVHARPEVRAPGAGLLEDVPDRSDAGYQAGQAQEVDEWEDRTPTLLHTGGVQMWVVGSDMHVPDHDRRAWQGFLDFIHDWRPHGVCINGDFAEAQSFSSHGDLTDPGYWLKERAACRRELARVRSAAGPRARIVYNDGNHEGRISRAVAHSMPTIAGLLTVRDQFELDALNIEHRVEGDALRLGKLRVVHGKWCPVGAAKKHVEKLGSCLVGHVHRPGMYAGGYDNHTQIGWVAPCLRKFDAGYLKGYDGCSGWAHGFAVVHVYPDGMCNCELIVMDPERRFAYGGRLYGG